MLSSKCLNTRYDIHKSFFENNLLINPKPLVGSRGRPTTTKQGRRTGVIENAGGPGGMAIRTVVIFVCISFLFVADCPLLFVLFLSFEIVICECLVFSLQFLVSLLILWTFTIMKECVETGKRFLIHIFLVDDVLVYFGNGSCDFWTSYKNMNWVIQRKQINNIPNKNMCRKYPKIKRIKYC